MRTHGLHRHGGHVQCETGNACGKKCVHGEKKIWRLAGGDVSRKMSGTRPVNTCLGEQNARPEQSVLENVKNAAALITSANGCVDAHTEVSREFPRLVVW